MTAHALLHDRLGPFRVEHLLGEGAMSEVYAAIDERLDRPVALKVLHRHLARSAEVRKRFATESRLAARLNHPHIVPIYEADEIDGLLYISMHRVDGSDLSQLLVSKGPLSPTRTAKIISQAASALDAAHDTGLIHRDVKPANMLVSRSERGTDHVFLSDFGLTKVIGSASRHTQTGQIVGTVHYMSPEQIEGRDVTHLSDVYSLGCVLYECLTGNTPFERESDLAVLWAHVNAPAPEMPSDARIPPSLGPVIERALAKSPEDRYASCGELARAVRSAMRRRHVPASRRRVATSPYRRRISEDDLRSRSHGPLARLKSFGAVLLISAVSLSGLAGVARVTGVWTPGPTVDAGERTRLGDGRETSGLPGGKNDAPETRKREGQSSRSEFSRADVTAKVADTAAALGTGERPRGERSATGITPLASEPLTRTVTRQYNAASLDGYGQECVGTNVGCVEFVVQEGEHFVSISIDDSSGRSVRAWLKRDLNADGVIDGEWVEVCSRTPHPVAVTPGTVVQVQLQRGECGGVESAPTTGTVTALFSDRS